MRPPTAFIVKPNGEPVIIETEKLEATCFEWTNGSRSTIASTMQGDEALELIEQRAGARDDAMRRAECKPSLHTTPKT